MKLPDSIYDLSFEPRAYEYDTNERIYGWVPCTVTAKCETPTRGREITITAHMPDGDVQHRLGWECAKKVLRPRREKRRVKGWLWFRCGSKTPCDMTLNESSARLWAEQNPGDTIVPFETDEFIDGERPDFAADEPALRPGVKVKIRKPDEPNKHNHCPWIPAMDRFDGMTGTLDFMYGDGTWRISGGGLWCFHPDWLTVVESENSQKTP